MTANASTNIRCGAYSEVARTVLSFSAAQLTEALYLNNDCLVKLDDSQNSKTTKGILKPGQLLLSSMPIGKLPFQDIKGLEIQLGSGNDDFVVEATNLNLTVVVLLGPGDDIGTVYGTSWETSLYGEAGKDSLCAFAGVSKEGSVEGENIAGSNNIACRNQIGSTNVPATGSTLAQCGNTGGSDCPLVLDAEHLALWTSGDGNTTVKLQCNDPTDPSNCVESTATAVVWGTENPDVFLGRGSTDSKKGLGAPSATQFGFIAGISQKIVEVSIGFNATRVYEITSVQMVYYQSEVPRSATEETSTVGNLQLMGLGGSDSFYFDGTSTGVQVYGGPDDDLFQVSRSQWVVRSGGRTLAVFVTVLFGASAIDSDWCARIFSNVGRTNLQWTMDLYQLNSHCVWCCY